MITQDYQVWTEYSLAHKILFKSVVKKLTLNFVIIYFAISNNITGSYNLTIKE